ncbi:hypothetical protein [Helicobacter sp. T3_23-1059]
MKTLKNLLLVFVLGLIPTQGLCKILIVPIKNTELITASSNGDLEKVKSLIQNGADVNEKK